MILVITGIALIALAIIVAVSTQITSEAKPDGRQIHVAVIFGLIGFAILGADALLN